MLERLIEQRSAVTVVLADVPTVKALSGQQWSTAAELTETLRPFLTATEVVSGAKYPTISMILPVVDGLRTTLRNMEGGLDILRDVLVELIDDKFADVFEDDELRVATVVDPRFKLAFFDGDEGRQRALDATKKAVLDAAEASAAAKASTPAQTSSPLPSAPAASSSTKQMPSIFAKLYAAPTATPQASTLSDKVQHELNLYIAAQTIDHTSSATAWWAGNSALYPNIAVVAHQLLGVPATSVASERLFSKAGDIITKKRNRLESSKADKIIFIMENLGA